MSRTEKWTNDLLNRSEFYDRSHEDNLPEPLRTYARELDAREPESVPYVDSDGYIRKGRDYQHACCLDPKPNISEVTDADMKAFKRGLRNGLVISGFIWAFIIWRAWPIIQLWWSRF